MIYHISFEYIGWVVAKIKFSFFGILRDFYLKYKMQVHQHTGLLMGISCFRRYFIINKLLTFLSTKHQNIIYFSEQEYSKKVKLYNALQDTNSWKSMLYSDTFQTESVDRSPNILKETFRGNLPRITWLTYPKSTASLVAFWALRANCALSIKSS